MRKRARRAATGLVVAPAIFAPLLLAGCSVARSKSTGSDHTAACALVGKLDDIAAGVARADVHDPEAFKKTLDTAVQDYVTNVKSLQEVTPTELHATLDRVESDVRQYRFSAAVADRADLDAYAARTCGRGSAPAGATSTTGPGSTSTNGPGSTTSVTSPASSTSVASAPDSSGLSGSS